jgi:ribosomal protein S18 acetylase RimI-like enzyme
MNYDEIEFREGTASAEDIRAHLERCDSDFSPNLSLKVHIEDYSRKIRDLAKTYEAWSGSALVGLVAAYMNDPDTRIGFITSVSVTREFVGRGIASALLQHCLNRSRQERMRALRLEVSLESREAIRLYSKVGFSEIARKGETVSMELELSEKQQS